MFLGGLYIKERGDFSFTAIRVDSLALRFGSIPCISHISEWLGERINV